jgi:hypothetical protein
MKSLSYIENIKKAKIQQSQLLAAEKSNIIQQNIIKENQYEPAVKILASISRQESLTYQAPINPQNISVISDDNNLLLNKIQQLEFQNQFFKEQIKELTEDKKDLRSDKLNLISEISELKKLLELKNTKITELNNKLLAIEFEQLSIVNNSLIDQNSQTQPLNALNLETVESILISQDYSILDD